MVHRLLPDGGGLIPCLGASQQVGELGEAGNEGGPVGIGVLPGCLPVQDHRFPGQAQGLVPVPCFREQEGCGSTGCSRS
ncbi:hypothetical protein OG590_37835 (plasmid) [Streptomyces goshikiensis]|uniref:hypothetical protein n=1 Tax=Streptomyces goshikiensis TaxID=1942 RepID=UPI002E1677CC|nr:hypothetical protein OG224_38080 [Streptomyces goshikiensis]WSY02964.1 hypothetical protein OG590_37835 [Streptomyces goshikiensis]